jgi:hypothetical protein
MRIQNCPECGRIFEFFFLNLCPECIEKEENESRAILNYLEANPGAGIPEISEATGISVDKIIRMLKGGRLIAVCEQNNINLLTCERCGRPIAKGNLCQSCRDSMARALLESSRRASHERYVTPQDTKKETKSSALTSHFLK